MTSDSIMKVCLWGSVELSEWGFLPVTRTKDDWDNSGGAFSMTLQRPFHLNVVAVVRMQEI